MKPGEYDKAVTVLADLRALSQREGRARAFAERFQLLREQHLRKPSLIERFQKAGLALLAVTMHIRHIGTDQAGQSFRQPHLQLKHPIDVPERIRNQAAPEQRMRDRRDQHLARQRRTNMPQSVAFLVKGNSPMLFEAPGALDWAAVPVSHQVTGTGHGRREKRTIQVMDAPDHIRAVFPHARQVFLIERYVTRKVRKRKKNSRRYKTTEVRTAVAALGITSLSAREAAPVHLAGYIRGHWSIENKIHWSVLRGAPACRMTWHRKLHGELLQHTSRGVVLVVAAGLTLAVSGHAPWCNTCGVTTPC